MDTVPVVLVAHETPNIQSPPVGRVADGSIASGSDEHIVHFARNFRLSFSHLPLLNRTCC